MDFNQAFEFSDLLGNDRLRMLLPFLLRDMDRGASSYAANNGNPGSPGYRGGPYWRPNREQEAADQYRIKLATSGASMSPGQLSGDWARNQAEAGMPDRQYGASVPPMSGPMNRQEMPGWAVPMAPQGAPHQYGQEMPGWAVNPYQQGRGRRSNTFDTGGGYY